jgi:hypothetical protein
MALELWTSGELYEVLTDDRLDQVPSFILDTFFTEDFFSNDKEILLSELPDAYRVMAPFVLPTEQGKPIFKAKAEKVRSFLPPYIKPKDAVRPEDARTPKPLEILRRAPMSLQERFNMRVLEVAAFHMRAIRMRITWMAARAFIDGKVNIAYERDQGAAFPEVELDYGRDAGHTVVLTTSFWDDPDHPILDDIQDWADTMRLATRGGFPSQLWLGATVAKHFNKNKQVIAQMDTTVRGNSVQIQTGVVRREEPLTRLGTVGAGIEVFVYKDEVENDNGTMVDLLDPKDIVLVAPGAKGVVAYGAIYDAQAMAESTAIDVFPKMWEIEDPSAIFLMHQSSPLPIPLYPNRTFKATVLE